jgi:hypothetical protein
MAPPHDIVDRDESKCLGTKLINKFLCKLCGFQNHMGPFASSYPWLIAEDNDVIAQDCHEKYSWVKQRSWVTWAAGSHLMLRVLVVQNITGRQPRDTGRARGEAWSRHY